MLLTCNNTACGGIGEPNAVAFSSNYVQPFDWHFIPGRLHPFGFLCKSSVGIFMLECLFAVMLYMASPCSHTNDLNIINP